jgi:hypothetical protein
VAASAVPASGGSDRFDARRRMSNTKRG